MIDIIKIIELFNKLLLNEYISTNDKEEIKLLLTDIIIIFNDSNNLRCINNSLNDTNNRLNDIINTLCYRIRNENTQQN